MDLWRISNFSDLGGEGGLRASGRWQTRGRRIVYLADHPASALLEMRVHMDADLVPATYQLLRVHVPDAALVGAVDDRLPPDWQGQNAITQALGDAWLDNRSSPLLRVPSAIVPEASNYLLNPDHPDAYAISVTGVILAPFDLRLLR